MTERIEIFSLYAKAVFKYTVSIQIRQGEIRVNASEHDLLHGSVTCHLIRLAAPLIAGNILQQFYNTFDVFVVGRCAGELEYAAIGAAATSILTAQNYGAGQTERVRETFSRSFRLLFLFGIAMSALMFATAPFTVGLLLGNRESAAYQNALDYLRVISVFYVFCFTGNTFAGYFEGVGQVRVPFAGAASHLTVRIILSALWIARYRLPAVAVATGIGWVYVNLLWGWIYTKSAPPQLENA